MTEEQPNTNAGKGQGPQLGDREAGYPRGEVTGVVLAGGRALRMGGVDKGLVQIGDRPMIWHVLQRLRPQVGRIVVNANRNLDAYAEFGLPIVADRTDECLGPLSGLAAGTDVWYEAKYHQLQSLAMTDPEQARKVYRQFQLLHPELGGDAWRARFTDLARTW